MLNINELKVIDNEIFQEFEKSTEKLPELLKGNFKYTSEVCFMYMNTTDFIKMSILENIERENFYCANILYRSLIEHFLRFNYYFFNYALNGKSDEYSRKFRFALEFNDKISIEKSENSLKKIDNEIHKSNQEIIKEIYDSNEDYKKFEIDDLTSFSNELSIKNIISFTQENLSKTELVPSDFFFFFIVQYSKLSSYVHGGMFAHRELIAFSTNKERLRILTVMYGLSLQASTFVKMYSYMILHTHDPEFLNYYFTISTSIFKLKE